MRTEPRHGLALLLHAWALFEAFNLCDNGMTNTRDDMQTHKDIQVL
jgi:hypothetical protein